MDEAKIREAVANPKNQGEIADADAVGTVGSPECGDMVRMWLKYREDDDGNRVIDRASFQSFGCQTALAVASVATEMIAGKTVDEALELSADDLSAPLGSLPPMKIHCGQMVEGALRDALESDADGNQATEPSAETEKSSTSTPSSSLTDSLNAPSFPAGGRIKIVPLEDDDEPSGESQSS